MPFNIAIDGPAGAGKSTVAKQLAKNLGYIYVDTGAMYRAMALYFLRKGINKDDAGAIEAACEGVEISLEYKDGVQQIILKGENVTSLIRTEEVGNMASSTSVYAPVRRKLVELQRKLAQRKDVVMDGRDIGTCVLPDANLKVYLTAGSRVRAIRRYKELQEKNVDCGVKRAVEMVYEQIEKAKTPIYTFGPIIHNEEVVRDLEERGVKVLETAEELRQLTDGVVVIRSHGVGKDIYDILERNGIEIIDATCPFVKKIHRIVSEQNENGRRVIIVGNGKHPEVEGIKGWGNDDTLVIETAEEFEKLQISDGEKLCIVAQTTFNYNKFQDLVEKISKTRYDILVLNTICNATQERQVEARQIASQVDVMIVIGGRNSSNTQKLYEICRRECKETYYIQTLKDFKPEKAGSVRSVGITAGASTPNQIIEEVHTNVRIKF